MSARFDNGIYRDCKWCGGSGCLACPAEADKEYKRQFPDGPKPILSMTFDEIDAADISKATGGPGIEEMHGHAADIIASIASFIRNKQP